MIAQSGASELELEQAKVLIRATLQAERDDWEGQLRSRGPEEEIVGALAQDAELRAEHPEDFPDGPVTDEDCERVIGIFVTFGLVTAALEIVAGIPGKPGLEEVMRPHAATVNEGYVTPSARFKSGRPD